MEMEMDFFKVNDAKYKNQVSNILLFEPHLYFDQNGSKNLNVKTYYIHDPIITHDVYALYYRLYFFDIQQHRRLVE